MRGPLWVVVALLLSGCAAAGPESTGSGPSASTSVAIASQDPAGETGSILVEVVTTELLPVEKAQVLLDKTKFTAFTDLAGVARFDGLDPGSYTVLAAKPGFQSKAEKGKIVDVVAGETAETKILMEAQEVLSKENFYHTTFPFTGFLTCSVQVNPTAAQTCGRQTVLDDPNGGSQHSWITDSLLVQTVIMEARWQSNVGLLPFDLNFIAYRARTCTATACSFGDSMFSARGSSPLYFAAREDSTGNLTRRLGDDPTKYPREHYAEMLVYCPTGPCLGSVAIQQKYDAWVSLFYGEQAPQDWSVIPKP